MYFKLTLIKNTRKNNNLEKGFFFGKDFTAVNIS